MPIGWAYVSCTSSATGQAAGPTGSVQFLTGTNATSGTVKFVYHTSAYGEYSRSTLVLSGNLVVTGTVSASVFQYRDITVIDATGSTFFGNSNDDRHIRTGSFYVGQVGSAAQFEVEATGSQFRGNVKYLYEAITGISATASSPSYILGVRNVADVEVLIPSASTYGTGAVLLVKDEATSRNPGTNITLNANTGYTIDGSQTYILTGTLPAISLYSNGANWFVF